MPLQAGTWVTNSNGTPGQLAIASVDPGGQLTGSLTVPGVTLAVSGFWDEAAQKISFAAGNRNYSGFLFQDEFRMPRIAGSTVFTLAGHYVDFVLGSADRPIFGWYAQIGAA